MCTLLNPNAFTRRKHEVSFGYDSYVNMTLPVVVVVLAAIPLLPLLTLFLIKAALRGVGAQLQSSTKGRREAITLQVTRDLKAARDDQTTLQENDDGWERIEKNGKAGDRVGQDTWSGIVGFFHPFW